MNRPTISLIKKSDLVTILIFAAIPCAVLVFADSRTNLSVGVGLTGGLLFGGGVAVCLHWAIRNRGLYLSLGKETFNIQSDNVKFVDIEKLTISVENDQANNQTQKLLIEIEVLTRKANVKSYQLFIPINGETENRFIVITQKLESLLGDRLMTIAPKFN